MDILMIVADEQALTALVPLMNLTKEQRAKDSWEDGLSIALDFAHLGTRNVSFLATAVGTGNKDGCEHALTGLRTLLEPIPKRASS
ncbi:MAG: hypothetical protein M4D80_32045 [Myxococcota bacterium]|nr:hypothetical protein [Myxococcota bacterium]